MGWNPWNCFGVGRTGGCKLPLPWTGGTTVATGGCHNFNESIVVGIAEVMADKLAKATDLKTHAIAEKMSKPVHE